MKMRNLNILLTVIFTWLLCANNSFAIWPFGKKEAEPVKPPEIKATEEAPAEEHKPASVQFREAYNMLKNADQARDEERFTDATSAYEGALAYYKKLAKNYPDHETGVTKFRIIYCSNQINDLKTRTGSTTVSTPAFPDKIESQTMMDQQVLEMIPQEPVSNKGIKKTISTAKILLQQNENEEAYQLLKQGLRSAPDNQEIRLLTGVALCRKGKYENAMYLLESLSEEDPANIYIRLTLGTAYFGTGLHDRAIREMKYALNIEPELHEAHFNLAQIMVSQDPPDKKNALSHYKQALKLGGKRNAALEKLLR